MLLKILKIIKISPYFPTTYISQGHIKVDLNFSNYATKSNLKK